MSDHEFRPEAGGCGGDVAAYALGALESPDADSFLAHLRSCVVCRDELAAFEQVVDALSMAAPQYRAPRSLRRRILREVRAGSLARSRRPRGSFPLLWKHVAVRPALAGGLALVVALVIVAALALAPGGRQVRVIQASVIGVQGSARLQIAGSRAELIVSHLPAPAAGHIYEVWVRRGRQPPSPTPSLFDVTASGAADVAVPGNLQGVNTIMVTQEPAGGSTIPSRPPVIVVHLTAE